MLQKIKDYFRTNYGYINLAELSDQQILDFMAQSYVADRPFESQMDLLQDYIVSQGLADVQE